jgi:hypothetical protein
MKIKIYTAITLTVVSKDYFSVTNCTYRRLDVFHQMCYNLTHYFSGTGSVPVFKLPSSKNKCYCIIIIHTIKPENWDLSCPRNVVCYTSIHAMEKVQKCLRIQMSYTNVRTVRNSEPIAFKEHVLICYATNYAHSI